MIVLDASVAAKWFLPERDDRAAHLLLTEGRRFAAPALIRLEVAGAIIRCWREGRMGEQASRGCCREWDRMLEQGMVHLISDVELYPLAVKLAFEIRHTVQDCLYLAAARAIDAEVVTADDTLAERGRPAWKRIRLLSENDLG